MQEYIDLFLSFIQENQFWAGPLIGLVALAESVLLLGLFTPATVVLIAVGALIGNDVLHPSPILFWGFVGCFLGDVISYYIGRCCGKGIFSKWPLNRYRRLVARTRLLFWRHGLLAIFLGRFIGPLRSFTPAVAGILKVKTSTFSIANAASAVLWCPVWLLPGYLGAKGYEAMGLGAHTVELFTLVIFIFSIGGGLLLILMLFRKKHPSHKKV